MEKCIDCDKFVCRNYCLRCRKCSDIFRKGINSSRYKHGLRHSRFWLIWRNIKQRCINKNRLDYSRYGGKGIKVEKRWYDFQNFRDDIYKSYLKHIAKFGEKNTTIDRINNNGNYCKENCRWATQKQQARNKRNNHLITYKGKTMCIAEWAEKLHLPSKLLRQHLNRDKWSVEKAFTTNK